MKFTIPQRLLLEGDKLRRELERAAKSGDHEARQNALQQALSGRLGDHPIEDLYGLLTIRGKPISKTPEDIDPQWNDREITVTRIGGLHVDYNQSRRVSPWEAVNFVGDDYVEMDLWANGGSFLASLVFDDGVFSHYHLGADPGTEIRVDEIRNELDEVQGWHVPPMKDWWVNFFRTF